MSGPTQTFNKAPKDAKQHIEQLESRGLIFQKTDIDRATRLKNAVKQLPTANWLGFAEQSNN
jgi:hypothetical protein